jgi:hypothetical protein
MGNTRLRALTGRFRDDIVPMDPRLHSLSNRSCHRNPIRNQQERYCRRILDQQESRQERHSISPLPD